MILELTQDSLIESSVYDCLSYISKTNGLCSTTLAYPKWPYIYLKVNILYNIIFPKPFTIFHYNTWLYDSVNVIASCDFNWCVKLSHAKP